MKEIKSWEGLRVGDEFIIKRKDDRRSRGFIFYCIMKDRFNDGEILLEIRQVPRMKDEYFGYPALERLRGDWHTKKDFGVNHMGSFLMNEKEKNEIKSKIMMEEL